MFIILSALGQETALRALFDRFEIDGPTDWDTWTKLFVKEQVDVPAVVMYAHNWELTSLLAAARFGHTGCLRAILQADARMKAKKTDEMGNRQRGIPQTQLSAALHLAFVHGHAECIRALCKDWAIVSTNIKTGALLHLAAYEGRTQCLQALLDLNAEIDAGHFISSVGALSALECAVISGHVECVKLLLAAGARVDGTGGGTSPLGVANNLAMVKLLIAANADVNSNVPRIPALAQACCSPKDIEHRVGTELERAGIQALGRDCDRLKALIRPDRGGKSDSSTFIRVDMVRVLLEAKADVHATGRDSARLTPLMYAAKDGECDCVRLLLRAGADSNATSPAGLSPVVLASSANKSLNYTNRVETLRILIKYDASPNLGLLNDYNPLMHAAGNGAVEMVHILLKAGANVNAVNSNRISPIIMCCSARLRDNRLDFRSVEESLRHLIEFDADVNNVDTNGRTALVAAREAEKGTSEANKLVRMLFDAGACGYPYAYPLKGGT